MDTIFILLGGAIFLAGYRMGYYQRGKLLP